MELRVRCCSKSEYQKLRPIDVSTSECWKIGDGFMRPENMFLVRLDPISKIFWQPEIWVDPNWDPASRSERRAGVPGPFRIPLQFSKLAPTATNEHHIQLWKEQPGIPQGFSVPAPGPTTAPATTFWGPGLNMQPAGLHPPSPQPDWTGYGTAGYSGLSGFLAPAFFPGPGPETRGRS